MLKKVSIIFLCLFMMPNIILAEDNEESATGITLNTNKKTSKTESRTAIKDQGKVFGNTLREELKMYQIIEENTVDGHVSNLFDSSETISDKKTETLFQSVSEIKTGEIRLEQDSSMYIFIGFGGILILILGYFFVNVLRRFEGE